MSLQVPVSKLHPAVLLEVEASHVEAARSAAAKLLEEDSEYFAGVMRDGGGGDWGGCTA